MYTPTTSPTYVLRYVTVVDRPYLRGSSYSPVAPGAVVVVRDRFTSQGAAVRAFDAILKGGYDFSSEYVRDVEVYTEQLNARSRTVRKKVDRRPLGERRAATPVYRDPELRITAIAAHASMKGNSFRRLHVSRTCRSD